MKMDVKLIYRSLSICGFACNWKGQNKRPKSTSNAHRPPNMALETLGAKYCGEQWMSSTATASYCRHDIFQHIYTSRLWTNYVLPEKHNSQHHITFWDKTVLNLEDFGWNVEHVNCCKCVPSVLVTINCANKIFTYQNNKRVTLIKITPGGAGIAILENYEIMLTSLKLNLSGGNLFYKSCSK